MDDYKFWYEFWGIFTASVAGIGSALYYLISKGKIKMLLQERKAKKRQTAQLPDNCFWNTHTRLHETLTELRVNTDCARAQIIQFHNGGEFLDGISMKKMSLTHESLDKGVSSEMSVKQDILMSMCIDGLNLLLKDEPKMHIVEDLEDSWCKQFYQTSNVIAFSFLPIKKYGQAIGFVMIQWCSWAKTDDVEEEHTQFHLETARNLIEIQLDILKKKKKHVKK